MKNITTGHPRTVSVKAVTNWIQDGDPANFTASRWEVCEVRQSLSLSSWFKVNCISDSPHDNVFYLVQYYIGKDFYVGVCSGDRYVVVDLTWSS